ncbi:MAG: tetratricopeptide repeat protein, partial [Acidobacteria bacterium]
KARFEQALALLPQAPEPAIVWLTYGKALEELRDWEKSRSAYTEALKLDPRSSEAHYGRAVANEKLKDFEGATSDALAAIREFPVPRKDAYLLLLRAARARKDQPEVDKYARELSRIDAEEAKQKEESRILRDLLFKAEPLFMRGQYVEAAATYEELVSRTPQFYEAYFALGMCYAHMGQLPKAVEAFRKYLALQPVSADGHASLGLVLLQTNQVNEARLELERALELDPTMMEARKTAARIRASGGDTAGALEFLLKAPNPEAEWEEDYYVLLVSCAAAAKRGAEAAKFCQSGRTRFPNSDGLGKACGR